MKNIETTQRKQDLDLRQLYRKKGIDYIKNIIESDVNILKSWHSLSYDEIFSKLEEKDYFELCERFEIEHQSEIIKDEKFLPKSFLIAAATKIGFSVNKMITKDYIYLNPYMRNMEKLYIDIDDVGIQRSTCSYDIFNGSVPFLDKSESLKFERYLASSISINKQEKLHIIRNINSLSKKQICDLISIFEEEFINFATINLKHSKKLKEKSDIYFGIWQEILDEIKKERIISNDIPKKKLFDKMSNFTPQAIATYLEKTVIGQNEAIKKISTALYYHMQIVNKDQSRFNEDYSTQHEISTAGPLLLAGATGTGKTMLVKEVAKFSNIDFFHIEASSLVEDGIVGKSTDTIAKDLLRQVEYDIEKSQTSIVFFDECDKLLLKDNGQAVLSQLLRFVEGAEMPVVTSSHDYDLDKLKDIQFISTKNMLIIFAGAFQNIIDKTTVGFGAKNNGIKKLTSEDILKSGLPKELLGRIKQTVVLNNLSEENYYDILVKSTNSPIKEYLEKVSINNNCVLIEDEVYQKLAQVAYKSEFGVRSIPHILEKLFEEILFISPEHSNFKFELTLEDLEKVL
ncbi:MAG: AAA family ATPase [Campylobacterota bacterium]|nr:AAA family ATPase [Campylobacterota bacterium]